MFILVVTTHDKNFFFAEPQQAGFSPARPGTTVTTVGLHFFLLKERNETKKIPIKQGSSQARLDNAEREGFMQSSRANARSLKMAFRSLKAPNSLLAGAQTAWPSGRSLRTIFFTLSH